MGSGIGGLLSTNPGALYGDPNVQDPAVQQALANRGLLAAVGSFGESAMPTRMPTPLGAVLGRAAGAMGTGEDEAIKARTLGMQGQLYGAQAAQQQVYANLLRGVGDPNSPIMKLAAAFQGGVPLVGPGSQPLVGSAGGGGGGAGGGAPAVSSTTADTSLPPQARALLDTISGPESSGAYNVRYNGNGGTATFDSYAAHPNVAVTIPQGQPHAGETSTAAGRYQIVGSTWDPLQKKYGFGDFSPATQDQAAWHLAADTYNQKTGRDLLADLQSGRTQDVASALHGQWATLNMGSYGPNLAKYQQGGGTQTAAAAPGGGAPAPAPAGGAPTFQPRPLTPQETAYYQAHVAPGGDMTPEQYSVFLQQQSAGNAAPPVPGGAPAAAPAPAPTAGVGNGLLGLLGPGAAASAAAGGMPPAPAPAPAPGAPQAAAAAPPSLLARIASAINPVGTAQAAEAAAGRAPAPVANGGFPEGSAVPARPALAPAAGGNGLGGLLGPGIAAAAAGGPPAAAAPPQAVAPPAAAPPPPAAPGAPGGGIPVPPATIRPGSVPPPPTAMPAGGGISPQQMQAGQALQLIGALSGHPELGQMVTSSPAWQAAVEAAKAGATQPFQLQQQQYKAQTEQATAAYNKQLDLDTKETLSALQRKGELPYDISLEQAKQTSIFQREMGEKGYTFDQNGAVTGWPGFNQAMATQKQAEAAATAAGQMTTEAQKQHITPLGDDYAKNVMAPAVAAERSQMNLTAIQNALPFFNTGPMSGAKLEASKYLSQLATSLGLGPNSQTQQMIASGEIINKEGNTLGFQMAKELGSREAQQVIQQAISSNPGLTTSPQGNAQLIQLLQAGLTRDMAKRNFYDNWFVTHDATGAPVARGAPTAGSYEGAYQAFQKQYPGQVAVSRVVPFQPKTPAEMQSYAPGTQYIRPGETQRRMVPYPPGQSAPPPLGPQPPGL
jgi:muramidase (phage lysozyme)